MTDRLEKIFNHAVDRALNAIAINAPDGRLTFAQLDSWAGAISARLGSSCADRPVAVIMPQSRAYFAALVGCMKAGAIAVPIDPATPDEQISYIFDQLELELCLSTRMLARRLPRRRGLRILKLPQDPLPFFSELVRDGAAQRKTEVLRLHCISTSGTSGRFTLVVIGRDALVVHAKEMGTAYQYSPGSCVANLASHCSAAGVNGFWRAALCGVGFVCFDLRRETFTQVYRRIAESSAVMLQGTPTLLEALARACTGFDRLSMVRQVIVGGEPVSATAISRIRTLVDADCVASVNYSSTETLHVAVHRIPLRELVDLAPIPVGRPLPSRSVALLDPCGRAVPHGDLGEIVITSAHIALELIGDEVSGRLKVCSENPLERVFWTRDLGRWNEEGLLEHHGRSDRQLKIRGERVIPTSVEHELEAVQGVKRAAVVGVRDTLGRTRLCACLLRDSSLATVDSIRAHLERRLSSAAIPSFFVDLRSLPLGSTGKTDYRALEAVCSAALAQAGSEGEGAPGESGLLAELRSEWSDVLGLKVEVDSHTFVEHGGDSLAAAALATSLERRFGLRLAPLWVARHPTLAAQADEIARMLASSSGRSGLYVREPFNPSQQNEQGGADIAAVLRRIGWM